MASVGHITDRLGAPEPLSLPTKLHEWVVTVDHKRLGLLYIATALVFFMVAGVLAALIRAQLAFPNGKVLPPDVSIAFLQCTGPPWCSWWECPSSPGWQIISCL
jgi:hypothetical protein